MIRHTPNRKNGVYVLVAALALSLVAAAPAVAHESPNHGTIKVHDSEDVDPDRKNQPHVSCGFWIEGFGMSDDGGWLEFESIPPTTNPPELVLTANWSASANEPEEDDETSGADAHGEHFLAGPFELDPGHYRVRAYVESGHPGDEDHFSKTKTFWVNECKEDGEGEEPQEEVPCPPAPRAVAEPDGDIVVSWDAVDDADFYRVYRAEGDDDLNSYVQVDGDTLSFEDTDTEVGVTYSYMVTAVVDGVEYDECPEITATAIPFFPGAVGLAVASIAAVGAYVGFRRRT